MKNIIGSRLKKARSSVTPKITQADLAARMQVLGIGIDRVAISKIESGSRPVSDIELVAIAQAIGVSASWLLGEIKDKQPPYTNDGEKV
jgi:transcriptional regulator with XRE-family HTH domain